MKPTIQNIQPYTHLLEYTHEEDNHSLCGEYFHSIYQCMHNHCPFIDEDECCLFWSYYNPDLISVINKLRITHPEISI